MSDMSGWFGAASLAASVFLVSFAACAGDAEISAGDLQSRMASESAPFVLDVRTASEYGEGHVPGAVNIPYDEIQSRLAEIDAQKGGDVVVYCQSGRRAGVAAEALSEVGFRVLHLAGDMKGWVEEGHPQETSE